MADSLIGLKSVTFGLVVIQFVLICVVDKTVLQVCMLRCAANTRDNSISASIDPIDTEPLLTNNQQQVRLYYLRPLFRGSTNPNPKPNPNPTNPKTNDTILRPRDGTGSRVIWSPCQRFWPGRVGSGRSQVSVSDPVFDLVLSFNMFLALFLQSVTISA